MSEIIEVENFIDPVSLIENTRFRVKGYPSILTVVEVKGLIILAVDEQGEFYELSRKTTISE